MKGSLITEGSHMKKVGNIIEKVMKELGIFGRFNEQKSILLWDAIVGERIAGKTKALYAREGKLVVEVENSTWMNELQFLKREIIEKLNEKLGKWVIDDIHFLLKT
jgi:predicted nucleic acid-binding Zn ribbon protein